MLVDESAADLAWTIIKREDSPNILARNVANIYVCNTVPLCLMLMAVMRYGKRFRVKFKQMGPWGFFFFLVGHFHFGLLFLFIIL